MLGVREPGEHLIAKESLKTKTKSKGTQDAANKSPVLGSVSTVPTSEVNITLQDREDRRGNGGSIRDDRRNHLKVNTKIGTKAADLENYFNSIDEYRHATRIIGTVHEHHDPRVFGRDLISKESECEHLKSPLESLEDNCEFGLRKSVEGSIPVLHNWRNLDHGVSGHLSSSIIEGLHLEISPGTWNRRQSEGFRSCADLLPFEDENERMKSMEPTCRLVHGHRLKRSDHTFSPLVLDPDEEMHTFVHSKPSFTLEEPFHYCEEESDTTDEWPTGIVLNEYEACGKKPSTRSRTHLSSYESRPQRKQPGNTANGAKKMQVFSSSASYMVGKRRPHTLRPIAWESDFFDHDLNKIEWPSKESKGLQNLSKHSAKLDSRHLFDGQENLGLPPDSRSITKTKSVPSSKVQSLLLDKQLRRVSHQTMKREMEQFPFFTELENYYGSDDEVVVSSNDGPSTVDLEGELELESCNDAPDKLNTGRIIRVRKVEECQLAISDGKELAICEYKPRNLSQKYRPKVFEDMVGQRIVTQALSNALSKGKIAPVYLFQGSRGTGKTTAARIFASALLCLSNGLQKPCGFCKECISVSQSKCPEVREVDAASNNGIDRVKVLLEKTLSANLSLYKVFIIEECHVLTVETWNALLKILEEPPMNVVFILITTDPDRLPRTVVSRCHKFLFPKIRDLEIVKRLQKLAALEKLAVDSETLQLIASRSDGSLRDAEITLDQVSLLGQQINSSTVQELVGSASDEKILSLLDSALQASTVTTVRKARELIDSGLDPLSLVSQLAALITDILAGSFKFTDKQRKGFFHRQSLSEGKLECLRMAMRTLAEAEKQLRASNDRATWLTAALLQLGPDRNSYVCSTSCVGTSVTQSPVDDGGENEEATDIEHNYNPRLSSQKQTWEPDNNDTSFLGNVDSEFPNLESKDGHKGNHQENIVCRTKGLNSQEGPEGRVFLERDSHEPGQASEKLHFDDRVENGSFIRKDEVSHLNLDDIWHRVVEKCRLQPLKQFLYTSVNPVSIEILEVGVIVNLEVYYPDHKLNCERSQKSIANLFESVLGYPVEIRSSLASTPSGTEMPEATEGYKKLSNTFGVDLALMHDMRSLYPSQIMHETSRNLLSNSCLKDMEYESCFEIERSIGDIEALSLESHELSFLQDKSRSTSSIINGRKSYDAYPPKMGIGNFKTVDQLPSVAHDDGRGSLIKFPRSITKEMRTLPMQTPTGTYAEAPERSDIHKKGKFKSTFSRLFQGKLSKYSGKPSNWGIS